MLFFVEFFAVSLSVFIFIFYFSCSFTYVEFVVEMYQM